MVPTESFDYEEMAQRASGECMKLKAMLEERERNPPKWAASDYGWRRTNTLIYKMYLEQRSLSQLFLERARERKSRKIKAGQSKWL